MSLRVTPFDAPLGAEISGLDLTRAVDEPTLETVKQALRDHHVIVFRDQKITPEQQIAFSRRFGPLQIHVLAQFLLPGHPEILVVSNVIEDGKPIGLGDAGRYWHSDLSYKPVPSLGSLLHARELPPEGGNTLFANLHRAYDLLPDATKKRLEGARAQHDYQKRHDALRKETGVRPELTEAQKAQVQGAVHPVVRTHPESGRKALFVSEGFSTRILDWDEADSDAMLSDLFARSVVPENIYRHVWRPHDMVFWDNRSVVHLATPVPAGMRRTMYRTTVEGDVPA